MKASDRHTLLNCEILKFASSILVHMEKLSFYGVGPKIGRVLIPYFVITISMTILFPAKLTFGEAFRGPFFWLGAFLVLTGFIFYFATLRLMLPGIRENRLITRGSYRICRNPLYAALILIVIPGVGLMLNSWIIITTIIPGYIVFRKSIHGEEEQLERIFGDEYRSYHKSTPLFFPNLLNLFKG